MKQDVRAAAALAIAAVLGGRSLGQAMAGPLEKVAEGDRGLLRQLCYGTVRAAPRLQAILDQLLDKPLKDKDRDLQGLLLCGLYQLEGTRIPEHAAVAATVGATRALKKNWAKGLTNAVLRRYLRECGNISAALPRAAYVKHPQWLFDKIQDQWIASADAIIESNNQQPPMTLRVNRLQVSRNKYAEVLREQGLGCYEGELSPDSLLLEEPCDVWKLPGFAQGQCSVQDEAAQLAALLLDPQPGERVLDACAAPGGKTGHLLEIQPGLLELVAMDVDAARLYRVRENLSRLGLPASVLSGDGVNPPGSLAPGSFDRILLDAPCSASGVIRRHPDVKLLRRESDLQTLADLQGKLLDGLWPLLAPGGTMLYATCSIFEEENTAVVNAFLKRQAGASVTIPDREWGLETACGRQLLPGPGEPDGLFYALLKKAA